MRIGSLHRFNSAVKREWQYYVTANLRLQIVFRRYETAASQWNLKISRTTAYEDGLHFVDAISCTMKIELRQTT